MDAASFERVAAEALADCRVDPASTCEHVPVLIHDFPEPELVEATTSRPSARLFIGVPRTEAAVTAQAATWIA